MNWGTAAAGIWRYTTGAARTYWANAGTVKGLDVRKDGLEIMRVVLAEDVVVTEDTVRSLPAVKGCCRNIARTIRALPCAAVRTTLDDRGRERIDRVSLTEPDHWLVRLMDQPNPWQSWPGMIEDLTWHVLLHGRGWLHIGRDRMGTPITLEPIHPDRAKVEIQNQALEITVTDPDGKERKIPWEDLVFVPGDDAGGGPPGISPLEQHKDLFQLALQLHKFITATLKRPWPAILLKSDREAENEGVINKIRKRWVDAFQGPQGRASVAFLEPGLSVDTLDPATLAEMQLLDICTAVDLRIARVFRCPPHKIALEFQGPLRNLEEQNRSWTMDTVGPQVAVYEDAVGQHLVSRTERAEGLGVRWEIERLVVGDLRTQLERARIGLFGGWLSPNDIRAGFGMPGIGDAGDEYLTMENLIPLLRLLEAPGNEPPADPDPDPPPPEPDP